jgi:hypothetical protein
VGVLPAAAGAEVCPNTKPGKQISAITVASVGTHILLGDLCALPSVHSVLNLFTSTFLATWEMFTE